MPEPRLEWRSEGNFKFGIALVNLCKAEYKGLSVTKVRLDNGITSYSITDDSRLRQFETEEELIRAVDKEGNDDV